MELNYKVDIFSLLLTVICLTSWKYTIFLIGGKINMNINLIEANIYSEYLKILIKIIVPENSFGRPRAREALYESINIVNYKYFRD